jgi:hypothetical protein
MNCYEVCVRGVSFKVWAPSLQDAIETFLIDMDYYEVPAECVESESVQRIFPMPESVPAGF